MTLFRALAASLLASLTTLPALRATDSVLDSGFVTTISPGLTPDSYAPPPAAINFDSGTGAVNAVALQSDGKIVAGGNLSRYKAPPAGSLETSLKRLLPDGSLDNAFGTLAATLADAQGDTEVNAILRVSGDKLYVGGVFTSYNGTARSGILRLNSDGSLDTDFAPSSGIGNSSAFGIRYVLAIAEQPDGKVLVAGGFNRTNGVFRPNLARLNADGSLDTAFDPTAALANSSFVGDVAILPNGQIIAAGGRNRAGGGSVPLLVRLNADGSLDESLSAPFADAFGDIDELLVLPDGRILIGGDFALLPTATDLRFACLRPDGSVDTAFMTNVGTGPNGWAGGEIALQPDGTIFVGGIFTAWAGQPRASIARLNPDGTLDAGFAPPPYASHPNYLAHTYSFAFQPDGKLVVGGWFPRITDASTETYNLTRFVNEYAPASPGTLRFVATALTTDETQSSVTLAVSRFGGVTGAVSVNFATGGNGGTASTTTDYTTQTGTLSWAAGEGGVKTLTVPLLSDGVADGAKTFVVSLGSTTGDPFVPATTNKATVTIRDADAAPVITSSPSTTSLEQGASFTLSVRYDSVLAAAVQWQRDPDGAGPLDFADIPGANGLNYTVAVADPVTHGGTYRARVTSPKGAATSAVATVNISVPAGSVVTTFAPADIGAPFASAQDSTGRFLTLTSTGLRRIGSGGVVEPTTSFGVQVSGASAFLLADDGRIYVGGNLSIPFTHQPSGATSSVSTRLFRLNADATGTIDSSFSVFVPGPVTAIAPLSGGRIIVGCSGAPTNDSGLRVFANSGTVSGTFPTGFATGTAAVVHAIRELPDGKILVAYITGNSGFGGSFTYNLARFTSAFALDNTFGAGGIVNLPTYLNGFDVLPDGRVAIAARFNNTLFGANQYLAILKPDGSFDNTFQFPVDTLNANPAGVAYRQGRLLVWGAFTTVNGTAPGGLVRVNLDGSIDNTFSVGAGANGAVNTGLFTGGGEIFIGGAFTSFKSVARNRAALLVGNPQIEAIGFAPPRVSVVEGNATLALTLRRYGSGAGAVSVSYATADGTALAGQDYAAAAGVVSWASGDTADKTINLSLLDDAVIESSETFRVVLSNPSGPAGVAASATVTLIDSDTPVTFTTQPNATASELLVGGSLALNAAVSSPSPATYQWFRNGVAISGATGLAYAKTPVTLADAGVYTFIATNASGSYAGNPVLITVRPQPGSLVPGASGERAVFTNNQIKAIVPLPDGGAYVGGWFGSVSANNSYRYFARVKADLSLDSAYNPAPNNNVHAVIRQPDGKVIVGGDFTTWAGQSINRLVRLNTDGSIDTAFNTAMGVGPTATVSALALLPDGSIVVAGSFFGFAGGNYLTVLQSTGAPQVGFSQTAANGPITELAVRSVSGQTRILAAGGFTSYSGAYKLVLLNTDGSRDTTFTNAVGSSGISGFNDLLVLADGRILAAGSNLGNAATVAQVGLDGSFASNIASSDQAYDLAEAPDGSIVAIRTGTTGTGRVFRLKGTNPLPSPGSADTDTTFNIGTGPDADPSAVAIGSDGVVWIGGMFSSFNGAAAGGLVKLHGNPANPSIVNPPANLGVAAGKTAHFGVGAYGTSLTYQWFKDGTPLTNGGNISGATSAILLIANASAADQAAYAVSVTGGPSSATVNSAAVRLYVLGAPVVATPPAALDVFAGPALSLNAEVFAAAPATFQWSKDGVALANDARITGVATGSLAFASTTAADTGLYTLTVTNAQGGVTTSVYLLVRPQPNARSAAFANLSASGAVRQLLSLPDGRMLVALDSGNLSNGASTTANANLFYANTDGTVANLGVDPVTNTAVPIIGGQILSVLRQSDGKFLLGGTFTTVNGVVRNRVARLHPDGSLDLAFAPGANNTVRSLHLDATGRVYVAGDFTNYGGVSGQNYLVRLDPATGALDSAYASGMGGSISKLLGLPDGGFLAGGAFFSPQSYLCRFDSAGARLTTYTHGLNFAVTDLALTPDGTRFLVSGGSSPYLARHLVATGAADPSFSATGVFNNTIQALAVQPDGKVVVFGTFNTPGNLLARVTSTGALDASFAFTGFSSSSNNALALDAAGRVWAGGSFTTLNGLAANRVAVFEGDLPTLAWSVQPATRSVLADSTVTFTAEARGTTPVTYQWFKDGNPLSASSRITGVTTPTLTILGATSADEGLYTAKAASASAGTITSAAGELILLGAPEILVAPAGGLREAGVSSTLFVQARGAGTLSYQWFRGTSSSPTAAISGATSASYVLASPATTDTAYYSVRVTNSLGSITSVPVLVTYEKRAGGLAFAAPTFSSSVNAILPNSDGSYVAGGSFTSILPPGGGTVTRRGLARILANGSVDTTLPSFPSSMTVNDVVRDSQGRLILAFNTNTITAGGTNQTRNSFARINADGTLDAAWVGPLTSAITNIACLAVDSSDRIYVGGSFTNFGGVTNINYLVRLDATTGARDTSFLPVAGGTVNVIRPLSDGTILVGTSGGTKRINATDGSAAAGFTYGGFNATASILPAPGSTDFILGTNTGTLERITSAGALVTPFPATGSAANSNITELVALPTGKIVAAGGFNTYNGATVGYIAHLAANGTADSGISFGSGFNNTVNALAYEPTSGRIFAGGNFTTFKGSSAGRLVILDTVTTTPADPGAPAPDAFTQAMIDAGVPADRRGTGDDFDGDGSTNQDEFLNGTNPNDKDSVAYRLTTAGLGATVTASPASGNSAYASGANVSLTATPDAGLSFIGWAPTAFVAGTGYQAAVTANPLPLVMNQNRSLVAYAGLPLATALDTTGLAWTTGGTALWTGVATPSQDGTDSAAATGLVQPGDEAWMETTVTAPGVLSLRWRLDTFAVGSSVVQVIANGTQLADMTSSSGGAFASLSVQVPGSGSVPVRIRFARTAVAGGASTDIAYVDAFNYGPFVAPTLQTPTSVTNTGFTLNWSATTGATGYVLEFATNSTFTTGYQTFNLAAGVLSRAFTGLTQGTTYHYRVTAQGPGGLTALGATGTATTIDKQAQTITFAPPTSATFGDAPITLSASASSGLSVSFSIVSGPGTISGNTLTIVGAGDIVIRAAQSGDATYASASQDRTLTVAKKAQAISFSAISDLPINTPTFALGATADSGLAVTYTVNFGPATVSGGNLSITGAGLIRVTASQAGNANFFAATSVFREFTATKLAQTISFTQLLPDLAINGAPFDLSATASSGLTVSYTVAGAATLSGNTVTLTGAPGSVTITATQAGNGTYAAADDVVRGFTVNAPSTSQTIAFAAIPAKTFGAAPFDLVATAKPSGLPVSFAVVEGPATLSGNTVTLTGAGTVKIHATQTGDATYLAAAPVDQTFTVNKAPQTIAFTLAASTPLDADPFPLVATATSGLSVEFTVVSGPATLGEDGVSLVFSGSGPVKVRANQFGDDDYLPAKAVERTITVANPVLSLEGLAQTYDGTERVVTVTGAPAGFEESVVVKYNGSTTPPVNAGRYTVVATLGAASKTGTLVVAKAPLAVSVEDAVRSVGVANPSFTLVYDGFIGEDSAADLDRLPVAASKASKTSAPNNYNITLSGGLDNNYAYVLANPAGTLSVLGFGGVYEALLYAPDDTSLSLPLGKVSITVPTAALTYTGTLALGGEGSTISLKGSLAPSEDLASSSATFTRAATTALPALSLAFTVGADGSLAGSLDRASSPFADLARGARLYEPAARVPSPWSGAHTVTLTAPSAINTEDTRAIPGGAGFATAAISSVNGAVSLTGKLADDTTLTTSARPDVNGAYRVWVNPHNKRPDSYLGGFLTLQEHPDTDLLPGRHYIPATEGGLVWAKDKSSSKTPDKSYRLGFGPLNLTVTLDPWLPPAAAKTSPVQPAITLAQRLGLADDNLGSGSLAVSFGPDALDLGARTSLLPSLVSVSKTGAFAVTAPVTDPANVTQWKILSLTPATGAFTGSFVLSDIVPPATKPVTRTVKFFGVLRQPPAGGDPLLGAGCFLVDALPGASSTEKTSGELRFTVPSVAE